MSIGSGIFLIVMGAILAFAFTGEVSWINLNLVGIIILAAGLLTFVVGLLMGEHKRTSLATLRSGLSRAGDSPTAQH